MLLPLTAATPPHTPPPPRAPAPLAASASELVNNKLKLGRGGKKPLGYLFADNPVRRTGRKSADLLGSLSVLARRQDAWVVCGVLRPRAAFWAKNEDLSDPVCGFRITFPQIFILRCEGGHGVWHVSVCLCVLVISRGGVENPLKVNCALLMKCRTGKRKGLRRGRTAQNNTEKDAQERWGGVVLFGFSLLFAPRRGRGLKPKSKELGCPGCTGGLARK